MKAPTLDEYIESQAKKIKPGDLKKLVRFADKLRDKANEADPKLYSRLRPQTEAILQIMDIEEMGVPPRVYRELGVAASYFLKRYDLIPDELPDIGFKDDAWVADRVFQRNRAAIEELLEDKMSAEELRSLFP